MKKLLIIWSAVVLLVISSSLLLNLQAQQIPTTRPYKIVCQSNYYWETPSGHYWEAPCNSDAECDRLLKEHNCKAHNINCGGTPNPSPSNNTIKSPVGNGILFALLPAGVGYLFKGKDGKSMWAPVALGAYGVYSSFYSLATSKERSKGANIAIAIIGGATTGASVGMFEKSNSTTTSPKPDNKWKYVAIGAVVMSIPPVLMGGKNKEKKSSSFNRVGKPDFLSKMSFGFTGNGIGIVVRL
jgi:hypothetical protein